MSINSKQFCRKLIFRKIEKQLMVSCSAVLLHVLYLISILNEFFALFPVLLSPMEEVGVCVFSDNRFGNAIAIKHPIYSKMESRHKQQNQTVLKAY